LREYGAWRKSVVPGAVSRSRSATAFRAYEPVGDRRAGFCRLEHVIPWVIQDAHWAGAFGEPIDPDAVERCSYCEAELGEVHVVLVRHRGEHRIPDGFCDIEHLAAWAMAGGRWQ
jgi:hypothetical protein